MATGWVADYRIIYDGAKILELNQEPTNFSFGISRYFNRNERAILSFSLRGNPNLYPTKARLSVFVNDKNILTDIGGRESAFYVDGEYLQTTINEVIPSGLLTGYGNNVKFKLITGEEGSRVLLSDIVVWYKHQAQY